MGGILQFRVASTGASGGGWVGRRGCRGPLSDGRVTRQNAQAAGGEATGAQA